MYRKRSERKRQRSCFAICNLMTVKYYDLAGVILHEIIEKIFFRKTFVLIGEKRRNTYLLLEKNVLCLLTL